MTNTGQVARSGSSRLRDALSKSNTHTERTREVKTDLAKGDRELIAALKQHVGKLDQHISKQAEALFAMAQRMEAIDARSTTAVKIGSSIAVETRKQFA